MYIFELIKIIDTSNAEFEEALGEFYSKISPEMVFRFLRYAVRIFRRQFITSNYRQIWRPSEGMSLIVLRIV